MDENSTIKETVKDRIMRMSGRNPGAMRALIEAIQAGGVDALDKYEGMDPVEIWDKFKPTLYSKQD